MYGLDDRFLGPLRLDPGSLEPPGLDLNFWEVGQAEKHKQKARFQVAHEESLEAQKGSWDRSMGWIFASSFSWILLSWSPQSWIYTPKAENVENTNQKLGFRFWMNQRTGEKILQFSWKLLIENMSSLTFIGTFKVTLRFPYGFCFLN